MNPPGTGSPPIRRNRWIAAGLVTLFGAWAFYHLAYRIDTDIQLHAQFVAECVRQRIVPVDFVYYLAVAALGKFSTDWEALLPASVVILALALGLKFLVTERVLVRWAADGETRGWASLLGALGLTVAFCLPIPGMNWYLGQFPPNQWHNSTTIAVMPLAVLLFFHAARFLERGDASDARKAALFTALGVLTKPSLFFAFGPVFPLLALTRFGFSRRLLHAALPVALGGILFVAYFAVIFLHPGYESVADSADSDLTLGWLDLWRTYSKSIPLSIANSILLPGLFLAGYRREAWRDHGIRLAGGMLLVGLILFSVVHETGARASHGNLSWQNIISSYLLHLAVVGCFLRVKRRSPGWNAYDGFLAAVFALQGLAGLVYVIRTIVTGSYL